MFGMVQRACRDPCDVRVDLAAPAFEVGEPLSWVGVCAVDHLAEQLEDRAQS
jgi:hypothetical protein